MFTEALISPSKERNKEVVHIGWKTRNHATLIRDVRPRFMAPVKQNKRSSNILLSFKSDSVDMQWT